MESIFIVLFTFTLLSEDRHIEQTDQYATVVILIITTYVQLNYSFLFILFWTTQNVNDPWGQHIYTRDQCTTTELDKTK